MADTNFRGPVTSMGSLEGEMGGTTAAINPTDGPSSFYQGIAVLDPRFYPIDKDNIGPGRMEGFFGSLTFVAVDNIPSATSTLTIAAAQAPSTTVGVALNLVTATVGTAAGVPVWATGVPIIPTNTTVPVNVSVIDFGFATGTTAANSSTVVVNDNTLFTPNQWIVIGGAAAVNRALITQVQTVLANGTGITISPVAQTAISHGPIGQGNLFNNDLPPATQFGPSTASANATLPYRVAGAAILFDPAQGVARNLSITAAATTGGTTTVLVSGYDIWGVPMTEILNTENNTATVFGRKAFKYIASIAVASVGTTGTTDNISIGLGNLLGFPLRNDLWEYTDIRFGGGLQTVNTGWTSAVTSAATNTSGDVRGTQNFSTGLFGATATSAVGGIFNGVKRAVVKLQVPQQRMIGSNPNAFTGLFGVTQA